MTTDIVLLYLGGEAFVAGAVRLALKAGMSALTVGLTVVAFGTSSPELLVINDAPCSTPLRLMSSHELLSSIAYTEPPSRACTRSARAGGLGSDQTIVPVL